MMNLRLINVYQVASVGFTMLTNGMLLKAAVSAGYFEFYKCFSKMNFLIDFTILVVIVGASFITYSLQSVLYTILARSPTTKFICTVVLGVIKQSVHNNLDTVSYEILLAFAFEETSTILLFTFYATYRASAADERERFIVVKLVIFHLITFVYENLMAANYVEAATMAIPVVVGLLALLEYNEAWITLRHWFYGHHDDLNNDFVEYVVGSGNGPAGEIGNENGYVV